MRPTRAANGSQKPEPRRIAVSKALREIGPARALRYVLLELALVIHDLLLLPPLRVFWLRVLGASIGSDTVLMGTRFSNLDRTGLGGLKIGARCYLGRGVELDLAERIEVLDETTLADGAMVLTHMNVGFRDHPLQRAFPSLATPVRIGPGAFIGARAMLLPGVQVGKGAFVAAGSVVTRSVPDDMVVGGNPARELGRVSERIARAQGARPMSEPQDGSG